MISEEDVSALRQNYIEAPSDGLERVTVCCTSRLANYTDAASRMADQVGIGGPGLRPSGTAEAGRYRWSADGEVTTDSLTALVPEQRARLVVVVLGFQRKGLGRPAGSHDGSTGSVELSAPSLGE